MRIGVLLWGRIQHYERKYLLNNLESGHQVDIFYSCDNEPQERVDDFIRLYNPVAVDRTPVTYTVDFTVNYPRWTMAGCNNWVRCFLNKKRAMGLLEEYCAKTQMAYDLIITTRIDLFVDTVPIHRAEPNTIYIPEGQDHDGINDRFAMGDYEAIKKYSYIFDNCQYLLDNKLAIPHPETLTLANLTYTGALIKRFPMNYDIIR